MAASSFCNVDIKVKGQNGLNAMLMKRAASQSVRLDPGPACLCMQHGTVLLSS